MLTINLFIPGKFDHSINFPSTWDELATPEMELLATEQLTDRENPYINRASILSSIIDMRAKAQNIHLPPDWKKILNYDDAATQGLDCISYMFEKNERTINPYPVLMLHKSPDSLLTTHASRFMGPSNDFDSITCAEMEACDIYLFKFNNDQHPDSLANIASILWRPRNATYKEEASLKMLPHFKKLAPATLFVIYMWYIGCRNRLPRYFPDVFGGGASGPPDAMAFTKCIHAGAGPKNGDRIAIRKMLAKEFLFDMQLEAEQAKKLKAEYDKH